MPFDADQIKKAIQETLNSPDVFIPQGHKAALVMFANTNKAEVALATKINNNWSVDLIAQHEYVGNTSVGVISKITW